jgi:hypothetical protein
MAKFLHTADWQMGMRAVHAGSRARQVREKRFEAATRVVGAAKAHAVEFVLLAGDTFEHHDVDDVVVKRTADILNQLAPIPTFILPGNHDPLVPGGVWDRQSWKRVGDHIRLCSDPREIEIAGTALYPCPLKQKRSGNDPTSWIPPREPGDRRVRIGLAHGGLDILGQALNFPIAASRAESSGLDYLALGDWHSYLLHGRAAYSGAMEPTDFAEHDSGFVSIVDILAAGAPPTIRRERTGMLTWVELNSIVRDITDVEALERTLRERGPAATVLARVGGGLDPGVDAAAIEALRTWKAELEETAFHVEWQFEFDVVSSDASIPDGILQRAHDALEAIQGGRPTEPSAASFTKHDPAVAAAARLLLRRLSTKEGS